MKVIITGMKGFCLTEHELFNLKLSHRKARSNNAAAAYKINAIILLGTGWKIQQVEKALLLDDYTLRTYIKLYREGGVELLTRTNHRGSACRLSDHELKVVIEELDSNIYLTTKDV